MQKPHPWANTSLRRFSLKSLLCKFFYLAFDATEIMAKLGTEKFLTVRDGTLTKMAIVEMKWETGVDISEETLYIIK